MIERHIKKLMHPAYGIAFLVLTVALISADPKLGMDGVMWCILGSAGAVLLFSIMWDVIRSNYRNMMQGNPSKMDWAIAPAGYRRARQAESEQEAAQQSVVTPTPNRPLVVDVDPHAPTVPMGREVTTTVPTGIEKHQSGSGVILRLATGCNPPIDMVLGRAVLFLGMRGSGKCLEENEPVFLADGRIVPAKFLVGKTVDVIGVTDLQSMQQSPVSASFSDNGTRTIVEIELDNGLIIKRTEEHPLWGARIDARQHAGFFTSTGKRSKRVRAFDSGWIQAKDLKVAGSNRHFDGHVVLCPTSIQQKGSIAYSDHDVIMCAVLLAEGGLTRDTTRFTSASSEIVNAMELAATAYECEVVPIPLRSKTALIDYRICNKIRGGKNPINNLMREWGMMGCSAKEKSIPQWVFQLPDKQVALFLRYFVDCDGWFDAKDNRTPAVNITLANQKLVKQIGQLALRLGIVGTYRYRQNNGSGAWTYSSYMVDVWQDRIGSTIKAEKLALAVQIKKELAYNAKHDWDGWRQARPSDDQTYADCPQGYEWRKVVAIRTSVAPTVSIEVHNDNHAFVGYAVEHNTNGLARFLEQICRFPIPALIGDYEEDYLTLPDVLSRCLIAGSPVWEGQYRCEKYWKVTEKNAEELGYAILEYGVQVVLQIGSYETLEEAATIMTTAIRGMFKWAEEQDPRKRVPCVICLDEAQHFLPQNSQVSNIKDEQANGLLKAFMDVNARGRKRGLTPVLATQRPAQIRKEVIGGSEIYFLMKQTMARDLVAYEELLGKENVSRQMIAGFDKGEGLVYEGGEVSRIRFLERASEHRSNTPGLEQALSRYGNTRVSVSSHTLDFVDEPDTEELEAFDEEDEEEGLGRELVASNVVVAQRRQSEGNSGVYARMPEMPVERQEEELQISPEEAFAVWSAGNASIREMAKALGVTYHQGTKLYGAMVENGLIERKMKVTVRKGD